ncbi:MAG: hypothetical protein ABIH79_00870 [archaeon]
MKKIGAFTILFLLLFSLTLAFAADNESTSTEDSESDSDKIADGFDCLEEKVDDCSELTTQEIAYTILATPDNVFDDCVSELEDRKSSDNWGNVRDTALAILALDHAGEDTTPSEEWLIDNSRTPTDLIWYLEQDSNEAVECHIGYDSNDYSINVGENKKIDTDAGSCLTRAHSNFWLEVTPECYNKELIIECDKDFIATLLYKNKNSPIIYSLEGTDSSPAFSSIKLEVTSKCFGTSSCEYESTAWATLALLKTGHNIEEYISYVIAMAASNEQYLPDAFAYMATNYEYYATQLITDQKLGNYWEAKNSAYDRYYDTALALIAIGSSSSEKVTNSRDWLLFAQGSNGCWKNSILDTAAVLWALEGRTGRSSGGGGVTYCSQAEYFCIPSKECPSSEDVGDNYFCASLSDTCCMTENLQSCSEYGGVECASEEVCIGNERRTIDTDSCCTGKCAEKTEETECESMFYTCRDSCSDNQEIVSTYSCNEFQVCCKTKTTEESVGGVWWIWVLIILILAVLGAIGYIYRENLKLFLFKLKTKFKKDKRRGGMAPQGPRPGMPPRPGFPPIRRMPMRAPPRQVRRPQEDKAMSDTFRKLREMSG